MVFVFQVVVRIVVDRERVESVLRDKIRRQNPETKSGDKIRRQNPETKSGDKIRRQNLETNRLIRLVRIFSHHSIGSIVNRLYQSIHTHTRTQNTTYTLPQYVEQYLLLQY
jgi:hypothetical protein